MFRKPSTDVSEVADSDLDRLEELLWEKDDVLKGPLAWKLDHSYNRTCREQMTGEPTGALRGFFSDHVDLFGAYLGSYILIRHSQKRRDGNAKQEKWSEDVDNSDYRSTSPYLVLTGGSKFEHDLCRRAEYFDTIYNDIRETVPDGELYQPTESSFALPIAMPRPLSMKSLARSSRALTVLGLEPEAKDDVRGDMLFAQKQDCQVKKTSAHKKVANESPQPELMFLMRINDHDRAGQR